MKNLLLLTVFLSVFKLNAQWVDIASTVGGITPTTNMGKPCVFDFNNDNYHAHAYFGRTGHFGHGQRNVSRQAQQS